MIKEKFNLTEEENKMCFQIAMRSHTMSAPYCWEKMQALAFLYTMIPVINKYYPEKEDRIEGYKRHWGTVQHDPKRFRFYHRSGRFDGKAGRGRSKL